MTKKLYGFELSLKDKAERQAVADANPLYPRAGFVLPPWTIDDGLVPGHYRNKPRGSKCFWAARYNTSRGVREVQSILDIDHTTVLQARLELQDVIFRGAGDLLWASTSYIILSDDGHDRLPSDIARRLDDLRLAYPEVIHPFDPPAVVVLKRFLSGWQPADTKHIIAVGLGIK